MIEDDRASVQALLDIYPVSGATETQEQASHDRYEAELNAHNGVKGWVQQIIPWSTQSAWDAFLNIVDPVNLKIVSLARKEAADTIVRQAVVLISPAGMDNLAVSNKRNP